MAPGHGYLEKVEIRCNGGEYSVYHDEVSVLAPYKAPAIREILDANTMVPVLPGTLEWELVEKAAQKLIRKERGEGPMAGRKNSLVFEGITIPRRVVKYLENSLNEPGIQQWLGARNQVLQGKTPLACLKQGKLKAVVEAALAYGHRSHV